MTTIGAAAAWHTRSPFAIAALIVLVGAGLGGCETSSNLLGTNTAAAPETAVATPPPTPAAKPATRISMAPVIGAPDPVAKQISTQVSDAMGKQRVAMAPAGDKADYTLRGYVVAAKEKAGTKVSYIWDVTDASGKRVHRVTGEEQVPGSQNAKDPWASVTPQLMQTIADRTATSVATWLPTQGGQAVAQSGSGQQPSGTGAPVQTAAASNAPPPAATPAAAPPPARQQVAAASPQAGTATGSVASGEMRASMPTVSGAPGDGAQSLPTALQRELSKSGINVADRQVPSAYRIDGRVALGSAKDGRQPIQIDWVVKDAQGNRLGTVSQKNEIEQGSLDGQWGQTAELAAAAAAQGIVKLMQPSGKTQTN